jgi:hypothetical protein
VVQATDRTAAENSVHDDRLHKFSSGRSARIAPLRACLKKLIMTCCAAVARLHGEARHHEVAPDRYLRSPDGWSRRRADVAERGPRRINWAAKGTLSPTEGRAGYLRQWRCPNRGHPGLRTFTHCEGIGLARLIVTGFRPSASCLGFEIWRAQDREALRLLVRRAWPP